MDVNLELTDAQLLDFNSLYVEELLLILLMDVNLELTDAQPLGFNSLYVEELLFIML